VTTRMRDSSGGLIRAPFGSAFGSEAQARREPEAQPLSLSTFVSIRGRAIVASRWVHGWTRREPILVAGAKEGSMQAGILTPELWAEAQFDQAELGDRRRTRRAVKVAAQMVRRPGDSIPGQAATWPATKAS